MVGYDPRSLIPVGKVMTFSRFVLNEIAEGNVRLYTDTFSGSRGMVRASRMLDTVRELGQSINWLHWSQLKQAETDRDDWIVWIGWNLFGYWANIIRNNPDGQDFCIKASRSEAREFAMAEIALRRKWKAYEKAKRNAFKQKELDAAWWP